MVILKRGGVQHFDLHTPSPRFLLLHYPRISVFRAFYQGESCHQRDLWLRADILHFLDTRPFQR